MAITMDHGDFERIRARVERGEGTAGDASSLLAEADATYAKFVRQIGITDRYAKTILDVRDALHEWVD